MTKKEAREALAEVYIRQLLEYGERVFFKVYPGLGTMIMEHVETAREWPIEA
jgi:hypothetical protein